MWSLDQEHQPYLGLFEMENLIFPLPAESETLVPVPRNLCFFASPLGDSGTGSSFRTTALNSDFPGSSF
jgi:hypothetical protein